MRHDDDKGSLAKVGAFASHVGAGEHDDVVAGGIQENIVGDEALAAGGQFLLLDHRVAAVDNLEIGKLLGMRMKRGLAVIAQGRDVRQAGEHIHFGQCKRGLADALGFGSNGRSQFGKESALDLDNLLLGVENFRFILFQLRRCEALGVDQSLLALVIGRGMVQIRFGDFNVVPEDRIELDLQRPNARALALPQLNLRKILF